MTPAVLDASLVGKLVFPEVGADAALARVGDLVRRRAALHAPDLLFAELANLGWKKVRRRQATPRAARGLLRVARTLGLRSWSSLDLAEGALEIALHLGCTAYDGVYLALAEHLGAVLHTADRRLADAVRRTSLANRVDVVG